LYDRPYWRDPQGDGETSGGFGHALAAGLPRPGPVVTYLLVLNGLIFLTQLFLDRPTPEHRVGVMSHHLGITVEASWQVWRYITFQFLHGDFLHIVLNMLALYFLGMVLEASWGGRRFLRFYLVCGVVAGVAYVLIGALYQQPTWRPLIGASGGVYGVLLACAVLFPQFRIIFLFFPVPIRLAALIIFGGMIVLVLQSLSHGQMDRAMSDVAHLGGAVAAGVWIWVSPRLRGATRDAAARLRSGAWARKMRRRDEEQAEIDRILSKIHEQGLDSLSGREKKLLREATERQRQEDRELDRL